MRNILVLHSNVFSFSTPCFLYNPELIRDGHPAVFQLLLDCHFWLPILAILSHPKSPNFFLQTEKEQFSFYQFWSGIRIKCVLFCHLNLPMCIFTWLIIYISPVSMKLHMCKYWSIILHVMRAVSLKNYKRKNSF